MVLSCQGLPLTHTYARKVALRQQIIWHPHALNKFPQAPVAGQVYLAVSKHPWTKVFIPSCLASQRTISWRGTKTGNGKILWLQAKESAGGHCKRASAVPKKRAFPPNGTQMLNLVKSKNFYTSTLWELWKIIYSENLPRIHKVALS